jgi:hypothetical protein
MSEKNSRSKAANARRATEKGIDEPEFVDAKDAATIWGTCENTFLADVKKKVAPEPVKGLPGRRRRWHTKTVRRAAAKIAGAPESGQSVAELIRARRKA